MHFDELIDNKINDQTGEKASPRRSALKIAIITLICITITISMVILLMLHKPSNYRPPEPIKDKQVSKYLTHVIGQEIYNGSQTGEPFDLHVDEKGINDIIARSNFPKTYDNVTILVPEVSFEPDTILLRGIVYLDKIELLVTVNGNGFIDENDLLHLNINSVKVGAVNITIFAKLIAANLFAAEQEKPTFNHENYRAKLMKAILYDIPFDPVFPHRGQRPEIKKCKHRPELSDFELSAARITLELLTK